jgi:hypothetical protein
MTWLFFLYLRFFRSRIAVPAEISARQAQSQVVLVPARANRGIVARG